MSIPERYDLVVLGSGEAGRAMALKGERTAVIEQSYVGGSCPNIACLPSKNVVHSANVASYLQAAELFGLTLDNWKIDMSGVRNRKRRMVDKLIEIHGGKFQASGSELITGNGGFVGPQTLHVDLADGETRVLEDEQVVISVGSRATIEPLPGLREARPLTHVEAREPDRVLEHLIILGGGYVGLEFAQALRRFGSRVTIMEERNRLAHREDQDVSDALHELFADEGIEVRIHCNVVRVSGVSGEHRSGTRGHRANRRGPYKGEREIGNYGRKRVGRGRLRREPLLYPHRGSTTFALFATLPEATARRPVDCCHSASSPTRNWRGSASTKPRPLPEGLPTGWQRFPWQRFFARTLCLRREAL